MAGRLARGQPQRDQHLRAVLGDPEHGQDRHRDDTASQADLEVEPIHVQDRVAFLGQVPFVPALEQRLQTRDDAGDGTLGQVGRPQQRLQGLADASRVGPGQVDPEDRLVDDLRAAGVTGQQLTAELRGRPVILPQPAARHPNCSGADLRCQRALLRPVAVAASALAALVGLAAQRCGELLVEHRLDRLPDPLTELGLDVLTELDDLTLSRGNLPHGVFLLRPSGRSAWSAGGYAVFLFPRNSGRILLRPVRRFPRRSATGSRHPDFPESCGH